jgi:O-antigen ligase
MAANASNTLQRRSPSLTILVIGAASASIAVLAALVCAQMYAQATVLVLAWGVVALVAAIGSIDDALRSKIAADTLVIWFATAPVAWYFIRFPFAKSIITYERLVFGLVGFIAIGSLMEWLPGAARRAWSGFDAPITKFEAVWLLLTLMACLSAAVASSSRGYALRTAVDAFALPLIAFYGARTYLHSRRYSKAIIVTAVLLGLLLLGMGAFEFLTGINLLPYDGSQIVREGELRVNGPFITDSTFAVVSLMLALFLRSAPRIFRLRFDFSARVLYGIGIAAAVVSCLLPLFRAVAIALLICWAGDVILSSWRQARAASDTSSHRERRTLRRNGLRSLVTVAIAAILLGAGVIFLAPANIRGRLTNPRDVYSRLLSWRVAASIIYRHPVFGVGLSNYVDYFDQEYSGGRSQLELDLDTHIVEHPHSNVVWIGTELGLAGLGLYLAANILLLIPACRAIRRGPGARSRAAGACFIVLMAAYWIPGLELTSGMYSELNLYFFFLLGLIFPLLTHEGRPDAQDPELRS